MRAIASITQLLVFNAVKRCRHAVSVRHDRERDGAPLSLYLGLLLHNTHKTRKRELIDNLFDNGLSVSYDRVLQLSTDEANRAIEI